MVSKMNSGVKISPLMKNYI